MNCQRFESAISELARGQMMEVDLRNETLAHCEECDDCHLRLRDQEMLSRSLRSLAVETEGFEAPAGVETELLKAFRARQVVMPLRPRPAYSRYIVAAVAAVLLIVVGVMAFNWNDKGNQPHNAQAPEQRQENNLVAPSPQPESSPEKEDQKFAIHEDPKPVVPRPRRNMSNRLRPNGQITHHVRDEVATEFMPLRNINAASFQEGAQIIRVEMPRSAMANFGYVVNMERANQRVKADVLLGPDGMAHAIRFVQ